MSFANACMSVDVKIAPQFTKVLITQVKGQLWMKDYSKSDVGDVLRRNDNLETNLMSVIKQKKFEDFNNAKSYIEKLSDKFLEFTNTTGIKHFNYGIEKIEPVFLKGQLKANYELLKTQIIKSQRNSGFFTKAKRNHLLDTGMIQTDYNYLAEQLETELKEDLEAELQNNNYEF